MSVVFAMLVVVVLNVVPADVNSFTMQMAENETIRFTRQADGGWKAVELPKDDFGTYYVDGTKVTMKGEGVGFTLDIADMLGLDRDTDWKTLKECKVGPTPVQIERKEDGLDFALTETRGDTETRRKIMVRWDPKEPK